MITILYPPGCYGTFYAATLFNCTNLSNRPSELNWFDENGSSHSFRKNELSKQVIQYDHTVDVLKNPIDPNNTVIIDTVNGHYLDYLNNYLAKQMQMDVLAHLAKMFGENFIKEKTSSYSDQQNSVWAVREILSFLIIDLLNASYNNFYLEYSPVGARVKINTNDLFINQVASFNNVCEVLSLTPRSTSEIENVFENFSRKQKHHMTEKKCLDWVNAIINGKEMANPCLTVYDEAFVQHHLRNLGYEIKCSGLNCFPARSTDLQKLLYSANQGN